MSDSESWESEALPPTTSRWREWRVKVYWRRVKAPGGGGHIYPAGVELRGWTEPAGLPADVASRAIVPSHRRPPQLGSDLMRKRIRWGKLLEDHRNQLAAELNKRVDRASAEAQPGGPLAALADSWSSIAHDASVVPTGRPPYALVRRLYQQAKLNDPDRVALGVLGLLQLQGYALEEANQSHRAKVRRWIGEAFKDDEEAPDDRP